MGKIVKGATKTGIPTVHSATETVITQDSPAFQHTHSKQLGTQTTIPRPKNGDGLTSTQQMIQELNSIQNPPTHSDPPHDTNITGLETSPS